MADHTTIILASQSPRRKMLLEWARLNFTVKVKETDESYPDNITVEEVPVYIARNKALAVQKTDEIILAADTVVVLGNEIIGKPRSREDAFNILSRLSGKAHRVITGVVLLKGKQELSFAETTEVEFHELTSGQIHYYIDNYKPFDKAGAYAIQEWIGVIGIKKINGDFYNVMGLPVSRVMKKLQELR